MIYNLERELQQDLQQSVFDYEVKKQTSGFIRREVPVGRCIPDLIAVKFDTYPNINRLPYTWSGSYSYIVSLLRMNSFLTIDEIAAYYYCPPEEVEPLLKKLLKYNLVACESGVYMLSPDYLYMKAEVISFEAKLFRWREALDQAITYKKFSHKVIVAMDPEGLPKRKSSLKLFEDNGIGLISVNKREINWLVRPKKNYILNDEYDFIITSTLAPKHQMFWSRLKDEKALFQA